MKNDKEMLLRYLASCIPYNIHGFYDKTEHRPIYIRHLTGTLYDEILSAYINNGDIVFKPLLRPVSNMTEKEMDKLFEILHIDEHSDEVDWIKINDDTGIKFFFPSGRWIENVAEAYNYLNSINIDYLGLINKDLAYSMI
jgi:hypothetical protein